MKTFAMGLASVLALAACSSQSDEEQLAGTIRNTLASQGNVQQVEMKKQPNGGMAGFAMIREPNGRLGRLNCTAAALGNSRYDWKCAPAIDEKTLREMEAVMRAELEKRGPVLQLEMKKAGDDNHMTGTALVKNEAGEEFHLACSAERGEGKGKGAAFTWKCGDASDAAPPAAEPS
jgi:hypothetical protein